MSTLHVEDAGYAAILADPALQGARRKLSLHEIRLIVNHARANLPKHKHWRPGEPDCPRELKGGNGELHTLRCKVCGDERDINGVCFGASDHTTKDDLTEQGEK